MESGSSPSLEDTVTLLDGERGLPAVSMDRIGRYMLRQRLAAGGMGVVCSAWDEELGRRVAIKLLHDREDADDTSRRRMRREAQALARLSHPNVVAVYEVGEHEGRLYLVMEHLQGQTFRQWMAASTRTLPEILDVLRQAGEGLAAAHAAGLVHRDFKPSNVLVADDGRARVLDFGLARRGPTPTEELVPIPISSSAMTLADACGGSTDDLTVRGMVLGTPPYMSPEQFEGGIVDARSDQFSFCVTVWEAVYGQRPFSGATQTELAAAVRRGCIAPPPVGKTVPRWLSQALRRGLSVEPRQRHPSMKGLLAALAPPARRRIRWGLGAGALGAVLGLGYWLETTPADAPMCGDGAEQIEPLWGQDRREAVRSAFLRVEAPYVEVTWSTTAQALDEFTTLWKEVHLDACRLAQGPSREDLLDPQLVCLDERLRSLRAALDVLERVDQETIDDAVRVAGSLPSPRSCGDAQSLLAQVPPPPSELATPVAAIRDALADASATARAGRLDDAAEQARAALSLAEGIDYPPVLVEAQSQLGRILHAQGKLDEAQPRLEQAYWHALRLGHDAVAIEAGLSLIHVVGDGFHRYDEAMQWVRHTEAIAARVGLHDVRMGWVLHNGGAVHMRAGRYDEARVSLVAALELAEQAEPADPLALASFHNTLGSLELMSGNTDVAHQHLVEGLQIREAALGGTHPLLVGSLVNLGNVEVTLERLPQALERLERALAVLEANGGRDHAKLGATLLGLDLVHSARRDYEGAHRSATLAVDHMREAHGPEHPDVGVAMCRVGEDLRLLGRLDAADEQLRRGLAIAQPTLGPGHALVTGCRRSLAALAATRGDHEAAVDSFRSVATDAEAVVGPDGPSVGAALQGAGLSLIELGRAAEAVEALERALAILEPSESGEHLAELRFGLARALRSSGGDAPRATELARAARDALRTGAEAAELRGRIDAWLGDAVASGRGG